MHSILRIAHAPGAVGGSLENVQKVLDSLVFLAWGALPPANGFQNLQTVIGNASKSIVKQSRISVSVAANGYGPWPCVGDTPEEYVNPNAESL